MIDCFDGLVVSWSIGTRPDAEPVNTMLDAAIDTVIAGGDRPVVHSDRGGHYRWRGWLTRMADADLVRSMSRKACSPDNAACEGFFDRLKNELFYARTWMDTTINEFSAALAPTSAGTTRHEPGFRSAHSTPWSTADLWGWPSNQSSFSSESPVGQFWISANRQGGDKAARSYFQAEQRGNDTHDPNNGSGQQAAPARAKTASELRFMNHM